jgi:hypothetical protein
MPPHGRDTIAAPTTEGPLADKSTRLLLDALARAVAAPAGLLLFRAKTSPGLFPPTAAARAAARRAKDDGFLHVLDDGGGKPAREVCAITDKGRSWLLHQASPRQVLEDFVRVLEERQRQADELVAAARQSAASVESLKATVEQLRPLIDRPSANGEIHHIAPAVRPPDASIRDDILANLQQWHAASPGDCPLPELYRRLKDAHATLTVGAFHDGLRELHARGRIYLHPWTGPLYDLPEPPFALLTGHEIAYYASTPAAASLGVASATA